MRTSLYNVSPIIYTFIWYFSFFHHVTLITTPSWDIQVVAYLKLMAVYGRENGGGVFLWLVSNIKVLVTASYVMGKCWTGIFVSVFCNARRAWNCGIIMTMLCHCIILKYVIFHSLKTKKCIKTMLKTFILHWQHCAYCL